MFFHRQVKKYGAPHVGSQKYKNCQAVNYYLGRRNAKLISRNYS